MRTKISWYGLAGLCICVNGILPDTAYAQFNIPLPETYSAAEVRREDYQVLFALRQRGNGQDAKMDTLRQRVSLAKQNVVTRSQLQAEAAQFCNSEKGIDTEQCVAALNLDSLYNRLGNTKNDERKLTLIHFDGPPSRPRLARYMNRSGASESFTLASQFHANVSENEAYVVTNIVRGLTGRAIFTADYAAVVTKSSESDTATRNVIEGDKANILRAVNNGGTLFGRFTFPLYARSGATGSAAIGVTAGGGIIGPIAEADGSKRKGSLSGTAEGMGGLAIRSPSGNSEQTAELIFGLRAGYTWADGSIAASTGYADVSFLQGVVGLRQNASMSVSALITLVNHGFQELVPKLVLNFAAIR